jgi:hypothetical protein
MSRCTPLTVTLSHDNKLESVYSIDEDTGLNITGAEYADLISFTAILSASPIQELETVDILKHTPFLDKVRKDHPSVGVLLLYLFNNRVLLIVDNEREVIIHRS